MYVKAMCITKRKLEGDMERLCTKRERGSESCTV